MAIAVKPLPRERTRPTPTRGVAFDDDDLLTLEDVGRWLRCSERKVYDLIKSDRPLPVRRIGFRQLVRVGDLRAWIRQTPIVGV